MLPNNSSKDKGMKTMYVIKRVRVIKLIEQNEREVWGRKGEGNQCSLSISMIT